MNDRERKAWIQLLESLKKHELLELRVLVFEAIKSRGLEPRDLIGVHTENKILRGEL